MSIVDTYHANCMFDLNFATGSLKDLSGQNNHPTVTTGIPWTTLNGRRAVKFKANTSNVSAPNSASLGITSAITLICFGDLNKRNLDKLAAAGDAPRILSRHDGLFTTATINYDFLYYQNSLHFQSNAGTGASILAYTKPNAQMLGVKLINGSLPRFYADGSPLGDGSVAITLANNGSTKQLYVGSVGVGTFYCINAPAWRFLVFNTALTDAEMAQLWQDEMSSKSALIKPQKSFSIPAPIRSQAENAADGCVHEVAANVINTGKTLDTAIGGVMLVTNSGLDIQSDGPFDGCANINTNGGGKGYFLRAAAGHPANTTALSFEIWLKRQGSGASGNQINVALALLDVTSSNIDLYGSTAAGAWRATGSPVVGKWEHIIGTISRTGPTGQIYRDGAPVTTTTIGGPVAPNVAANGSFYIGRYSGAVGSNSAVVLVRYYNRVLSATEIRNRYLQGAKKVLFDGRLPRDGSCPVMLSSLNVVGASILGTPWTISRTGTNNKIIEEAPSNGKPGKRWYGGAPNFGYNARATDPSAPYGSWYWQVRAGATTTNAFHFISSTKNPSSSASGGFTGYELEVTANQFRLLRTNTPALLFATSSGYISVDTPYEFWITRNYAGVFTVWIKGGAFTTWTQAVISGAGSSGSNPATDTTFTTNKYICIASNNGGAYCGDIVHYLGEMTPTEAISLGLIT